MRPGQLAGLAHRQRRRRRARRRRAAPSRNPRASMPATRSTRSVDAAGDLGDRRRRTPSASASSGMMSREQDPRLRVVRDQPDQLVDARHERPHALRGRPWAPPPRCPERSSLALRLRGVALVERRGLSAPTADAQVARPRPTRPRRSATRAARASRTFLRVLADRGLALAQRHLERRREEDRREGADQHADEQRERDVPQRAGTEEERTDEQDRRRPAAARRPRC